ncbi:uncharacterized protein TTMY_1221 [Thermus thermophilus]|uniref:YfjI family protein n=1 Tax=Thermus thermophilus TaxID=274 RepID=UPI00090A32FE|nr:YfjI family protein [Thermus thermophilus]BAW01615.1 uncharacterized protein TTMY_1221 [Thermus thermophilus]BDB12231.1 hypothetical protein TthTMY_19700 [Thermus thermophilus]
MLKEHSKVLNGISQQADELDPEKALEALRNAPYVRPEDVDDWPEPLPLFREADPPEPYPLEALGPLEGVVREALRVVQGAEALTAAAFLAGASLGAQGIANAVVDGRTYPASLFFLTVADSGERKTELDRLALLPARAWQTAKAEVAALAEEAWRAEREAWEAERRRIQGEKGLSREERAEALKALGLPPARPWSGMFLLSDATTEAIVSALADDWPSVGLFVSEAGVFLGGHAMSEERRLYTISVLSRLWDGQGVERARQGDGKRLLLGRRLSVHLGMQPEVARDLLEDRLVRNQGLLARFFTAWAPQVGPRRYVEEDLTRNPAYIAYQGRLDALLEATAGNVRDDPEARVRGLELPSLPLHPAAKRLYVAFFEHLEAQKEELGEARAFAAKTPEHAVRLALVLGLFEDPSLTRLGPEHMERGIALAEWYMLEHRRLMEGARVPEPLRRAARLLEWLRERARGGASPIATPDVVRYGPRAVGRTTQAVREALRLLEAHGYVRVHREGRREVWELNPRAL